MDIEKVVEIIKNGELALIPTDTVYGIIGDATNIDVIEKVYDAKERDYSKALLIEVSSIQMLMDYIESINDLEKKLMNYWPGKLTILLKKNNKLSDTLTSGSPYVGVRIPDNKELIEIIEKVGKPIISTSANLAGEPTITKIELLNDKIRNKMSYIYDGGEMSNVSSTLVKVENDEVVILRHGELSEQIIKDFEKK